MDFLFFPFLLVTSRPGRAGASPRGNILYLIKENPVRSLQRAGRGRCPLLLALCPPALGRLRPGSPGTTTSEAPAESIAVPVAAPAALPVPARGFHAFPAVLKPQKQLFNCFALMLARCTMPGASAGLFVCFFSFRIALCQWLILGLAIKGVIPPLPS